MMEIWWIIGCTALAIIVLGWIDYRLNKRFDKVDKDHANFYAGIERAQQENINAQNKIVSVLISMRDNAHHYYETIRQHLLAIIGWDKP
jgi:hypothetical protein